LISSFAGAGDENPEFLDQGFLGEELIFRREDFLGQDFFKSPSSVSVHTPSSGGELVLVAAVLSDKSFVKIVNGFAGGYAKPEIVVLAHGKGFIEASDLIKEISTDKRGGRANATQG
jgi:hypothetical protein